MLVDTPEWTPAVTDYRQSPVAFVLYTPISGILVEVVLSSDTAGTFQVKADPADPKTSILGNALETQVVFTQPGPTTIEFSLSSDRLQNPSSYQVGYCDEEWTWSFSSPPSNTFEAFATSKHRSYTLLGFPGDPWDALSESGKRQPWEEVLNVACQWAAGAQSAAHVATRIAGQVFGLGEKGSATPLRYSADPVFTVLPGDSDNIGFNLQKFLAFLAGDKLASASTADCDDVAVVIATFSNILGANLIEARMTNSAFDFSTQKVRLIGTSDFQSQAFSYHTLAWGGGAGFGDPVWDGCLVLPPSGKGSPEGVPPLAISFGAAKGGYLRAVVASNSQVGPLGPLTPGNLPLLRNPETFVWRGDLPTPPPQTYTELFALRFSPLETDVPNATQQTWQEEDVVPNLTAYRSDWSVGTQPQTDIRLEITVVPQPSSAAATAYSNGLIASFSQPLMPKPGLGDAAFVSSDGSLMVMNIGNLSIKISNIGFNITPLDPYAESLLAALSPPPGPSPQVQIPAKGIAVADFLNSIGNPPPNQSVVLHGANIHLDTGFLFSTLTTDTSVSVDTRGAKLDPTNQVGRIPQ